MLFNNDKQPFLIKDDPKKDKRQNVSFVYLSSYDFRNENEEKFPYDVEAFRNAETNKNAVKLTTEEQLKIARLGTLRIWNLKEKLIKNATGKKI